MQTQIIEDRGRTGAEPFAAAAGLRAPRGELISFPEKGGIPARHEFGPAREIREYLVDGVRQGWDGPVENILSPVCERLADGRLEQRVIGYTPLLGRKEALAAIEAAERAYDGGLGSWPMMTTEQRIECMESFLEKMKAARSDIVKCLMWEIAKTEKNAAAEFDRTVKYMEDTIDEVRRRAEKGEDIDVAEGVASRVMRGPRGVMLCLGPSNYPLNETLTTLLPGILVGNTAIMKPARYGVLFMEPLVKAFQESFPPGVVNVIYGDGKEVVGPLMESGKVDVLAFIGSERVAEILINQHPAKRRLHAVLGLGAIDPAIVMPGADLRKVAKEHVRAALGQNGQRCTALKRAFVHEDVAGEFAELVAEEVTNLVAGMPFDGDSFLTPLYEAGKGEWLAGVCKDAVMKGAEIVNPHGGEHVATYFHPAVLFPVKPGMEAYKVEQFGPIVPICTYRDLREVLEWVKDNPYKQQASLFGGSIEEQLPIARALTRLGCRVNLDMQCQRGPDNRPFSAKGDGGKGTLSVTDALDELTVPVVIGTRAEHAEKLAAMTFD